MSTPVWTPVDEWFCQLLPGDRLTATDLAISGDGMFIAILGEGPTHACVGVVCDAGARLPLGNGLYSIGVVQTVDTAPLRESTDPIGDCGSPHGVYHDTTLYTFDPGVARIFGSTGAAFGRYGFPDDTWTGPVPPGFAAPWADATAYTVGNAVVVDGQGFACRADHTSDPNTRPTTGMAWTVVWQALPYVPALFASVTGITVQGDTLYVADERSGRLIAFGLDGSYRATLGIDTVPRMDPQAVDYRSADTNLWVQQTGRTGSPILQAYALDGTPTSSAAYVPYANGVAIDAFRRVAYGQRAHRRADGQWVIGGVYDLRDHKTTPVVLPLDDTTLSGEWYLRWAPNNPATEVDGLLYATNGTYLVLLEYGEEQGFTVAVGDPEPVLAGDTLTVSVFSDGPDGAQATVTLNVYEDTGTDPVYTTAYPVTFTARPDGFTWVEVHLPVPTATGTGHVYRLISTLTATWRGTATTVTSNTATVTTTLTWTPAFFTSTRGAGRVYCSFADYRGHPYGWDNPLYNFLIGAIDVAQDTLHFAAGDGTHLEADGLLGTEAYLSGTEPVVARDGSALYLYVTYPGFLYQDESGYYGPEGWEAMSLWYKLDLTTGLLTELVRYTDTPHSICLAPTMAPDGSGIYYLRYPDSVYHDYTIFQVWKLDLTTLEETHIAGQASNGFGGDGGPATDAYLHTPFDIAVSTTGDLFICDTNNHRIRRVATDGSISTVYHDTAFSPPTCVAADSTGNCYFVRSTGASTYSLSKVAQNGTVLADLLPTISGRPTTSEEVLHHAGVNHLSCDAADNLLISGVYARDTLQSGSNCYAVGPAVYVLPKGSTEPLDLAGWYTGTGYSGTLTDGGSATGTLFGFGGPSKAIAVGNVLLRSGGLHASASERFGVAREVFAVNGGVYFREMTDGTTWTLPVLIEEGVEPTLVERADALLVCTFTAPDGTVTARCSRDAGRTWTTS
jgi:hypothetical protein